MDDRVTRILEEVRRDTPGARDELFRIVYGELRSIATAYMRGQPKDHTLQPTALVHEVVLRLLGPGDVPWRSRAAFFLGVSKAMRSVLVDFARARRAAKRGAGRVRVTWDEPGVVWTPSPEEVLAVHEAVDRLAAEDPELAEVVELRFFAGLTVADAARVMQRSERTVYVLWEHARVRLYRELVE